MHSGKPRDDHAQWERAVMLQRQRSNRSDTRAYPLTTVPLKGRFERRFDHNQIYIIASFPVAAVLHFGWEAGGHSLGVARPGQRWPLISRLSAPQLPCPQTAQARPQAGAHIPHAGKPQPGVKLKPAPWWSGFGQR